MEKRFYFRNSKTGDLCEIQAENSDKALLLCLKNTDWKMTEILYEGSLPLGGKEPGKETKP